MIELYIRKFEPLKTPSVINVDDKYPSVISFLEELSIDTKNFKISNDFLSLREKPIYKIDQNNFVFLNLNFLVDKIFQGIQFDFAKVLVNNSSTFNNKIIKKTVDFIGIFGNEFSETCLFYNIMNYSFEKSKYVKFEGDKIKSIIGNGEPDYYIRDKSKVYIFEFKNIYLSSEVKQSNDFETINTEIFKKLVKNQSNSPKGVTQLVNVIGKIRNGEFNKFDAYNYENTIIYPIIVYVDFSFNLSGINYLLNKEFRSQLLENKTIKRENIKDLILIDLDTFIKFQDLFRNKTLKLNNCFNEYYDLVNKSKDIEDRISTFNMFIHNKTRKIKYDSPKMLRDEVIKIMPNYK